MWKSGCPRLPRLSTFAHQHLLPVLSEEGELTQDGAIPNRFTELSRFPALEGKA
jgi:hypothetical protein